MAHEHADNNLSNEESVKEELNNSDSLFSDNGTNSFNPSDSLFSFKAKSADPISNLNS